jgi:1-phosphofructokinase family hexose kinase
MLARDPSTRLVRQRFTTIQNDTRINVTVTNEADHNQTRLTFPGPRISSAEKTKLLKTVRGLREKGILILGGSYPPGFDDGFARSLLNAASRAGLGLIVDVPAAFLLPLIADAGPRLLLIKPNQHELEEMVGKRLRSAAALQAAMLRLRKRAAMVCVSLGPQGALLGAGGRLWRCQPLKIHARGSVGAGDSMVGAMATRLEKWGIISPEQVDQASEKVIRDIFAWGVAAGAATAEAQGTALAHPARIRQLVGRVKIEPLRS